MKICATNCVPIREIARHALILLSLGAANHCKPLCSNRIIDDIQSPNKQYHAVVFQRDCGATTSFSTQVSLLHASDDVSGGGNVFITDSRNSTADATAEVKVAWASNDRLIIRYPASSFRIFRQERNLYDIAITYKPL
jgi:hypothetical protein